MLKQFSHEPKFVGVRHLINVEPDPDWIMRSAVIELTPQPRNCRRKNGRGSLAERRLRYIVLYCRSGGKMCSPQLRQAFVSVVCAIVFLSGCATPQILPPWKPELRLLQRLHS